jgi:hypothetical protein
MYRLPRVEADEWVTDHQGTVGENWVQSGIRNDQLTWLQDRVTAEGNASAGLAGIQSLLGLEPLPIAIDQADGRNRYVEGPTGKPRHPVKLFFRQRIEQAQRRERPQALGFVERNRRSLHDLKT